MVRGIEPGLARPDEDVCFTKRWGPWSARSGLRGSCVDWGRNSAERRHAELSSRASGGRSCSAWVAVCVLKNYINSIQLGLRHRKKLDSMNKV
eukprot:54479-Amphidinium_carterae.1